MPLDCQVHQVPPETLALSISKVVNAECSHSIRKESQDSLSDRKLLLTSLKKEAKTPLSSKISSFNWEGQ